MNKELLKQYAEFAVKVGANPQPCQTLIINAPLEGAEFARMCAEAGYDAGAKEVVVYYKDEKLARLQMQRTAVEVLEDIKPNFTRRYLDYIESEGGACLLHIVAEDPDLYAGIDPEKIARASKARSVASEPYRDYTMKDKIQWSIVAIPSPAWANKVFPGDANAEEKLWNAIFDVCRVKEGGDVVSAWKEHVTKTSARRDRMNELNIDSLHYKSANGTDLVIGLADDAVWEGASSKTPEGYSFIANIPTEEVFTAPHKDRVDGIVHATKPYAYNGNVIEGFWLRFEKGKVVEYHAERNEEVLGKLLDTDEGARHIGEVALVPASSPINRSGLLFFNTLFDENAACHIAFGNGYPGTVKGGTTMTDEELLAHGVNKSLVHEDIMVGAEDMSIIATTKSGETVTIFENGEWAF